MKNGGRHSAHVFNLVISGNNYKRFLHILKSIRKNTIIARIDAKYLELIAIMLVLSYFPNTAVIPNDNDIYIWQPGFKG